MTAPVMRRRGPLSENERTRRLKVRRARAEERRLHALALEIVAAGYRVVAGKHHPDRGGDTENFLRVGRVRELMLALLPDPRNRRAMYVNGRGWR